MVLPQFLLLRNVDNKVQKVYQNPPIRKSKNLGLGKGGFSEKIDSGRKYA